MPKQGRTEAEFRENHDKAEVAHRRAKAALRQLDDDRWLYEGEFIKLAKMSQGQWGMVADAYADHVVIAKTVGKSKQGQGRRVICGSKRFAAQLRQVAAV